MKFIYLLTLTVCLIISSKTSAQNCDNLCITSYDPVCGTNPSGTLRMFQNICLMNLASCRERTGIKFWLKK